MKYYVVADIHSYSEPLITALKEKGFFDDKEPRKLIVCGDLFDRGSESLAIQDFIVELMGQNQVILIRGNHEDLMLDMLNNWEEHSYLFSQHISNGTIGTVLQLTQSSEEDLRLRPKSVYEKMLDTPFIKSILPLMRNFYETEHYVFVHGWIPCRLFRANSAALRYEPIADWRNASAYDWNLSRWTNGMDAAHYGVIDDRKTIVCGHWHCSFGHSRYEGKGSEFGKDADYSPYIAKGIVALDACTALSQKTNCIVVED